MKSERQLSISLSQQSMFVVQCSAKAAYAVYKVLATFAVVVNMDLDVRDSFTNHFRQRFHQRGMIFLFRKEEGISGRIASGIRFASPRDLRPCQTAIKRRATARSSNQRAAILVRNGPQWSPRYAGAGVRRAA